MDERDHPKFIREHLGVVMERLVLELQGVPCISLAHAIPANKTIVASRSFGRPVLTLKDMREALATYVGRAAEKLRRQQLVTPALVVFIETNRFRPDQRQHNASQAVQLPVATADTGKLTAAALKGLDAIFREGPRYKKAGIILLDLHHADAAQHSLFASADDAPSQARMRVLDAINKRFGRGSIGLASAGISKGWGMRRGQMSAAFTTDWNELLAV